MELKERIKLALDASGLSKSAFALACDVSKPAVTHWLNGETKALKGPSAALMESCSGYRSQWLINETGPRLVADQDDANVIRIAQPTTRQSLEAFGAIIENADSLTRAQIKSLVLCMFDDVSTIPQAVEKIEQAICPHQQKRHASAQRDSTRLSAG